MPPSRRQLLQLACAALLADAPQAGARPAARRAHGRLLRWAGDWQRHGHVDGAGSTALFFDPRGLCSDPRTGDVLVADAANAMVRRIRGDGMVSSVAGIPELRKTLDGPAAQAGFVGPDAVAVGRDGTVYICDSYANTLRVLRGGRVRLLAGADQLPGYADGVGAQARFNHPVGVAVDPRSGDLLVADAYNHTVRRVTGDGRVSTLAGTPGISDHRDGASRHALFNTPVGVAVARDGSVYVSEFFNHDVRRISPQGEVSTVAGIPGRPGDADGPLHVAMLRRPQQIALDGAGRLLIVDAGNRLLRRLDASGRLRTLAGRPGGEVARPGALPAALGTPYGVAVGPRGSIAVSSGQAVFLVRLDGA